MTLRCPIATCTGWVSHIEDEPEFWGCGTCGTTWFTQQQLQHDIQTIIKKYPYRTHVYLLEDAQFKAATLNQEPNNYEALVHNEWND